MSDKNNSLIKYSNFSLNENKYTQEDALREFDELKEIALNCIDKNGNPNISAALRAIENKAKIAGFYSNKEIKTLNKVQMNQITLDGKQLKLNIGEDFE